MITYSPRCRHSPTGASSTPTKSIRSGAIIAILTLPWLTTACSGAGDKAERSRALPSHVAPVSPTFASDVAPVIYRRCASCHYPDGAAPFSLLTYEDARMRADQIAAVTAKRYMPPWLPKPGYARFIGERRLTDQEIRLFARWAETGAPAGNLALVPPPPALASLRWQLGEPNLVLDVPGFTVPAGNRDIYRNLVVRVPGSELRWVESVELRPGRPGVVHHARLMVDSTRSSADFDAADPAPGFDGMELVSGATNPEGSFVGWTPGKVPSRGRGGLAWPLHPGTDIVLQLHLPPRSVPARIEPRIGLYFADRPPARLPSLVTLQSHDIDIPSGDSAYVVVETYKLPIPVEALGVYPHAHYLAKQMQGYAILPTGERRVLIQIDNWDFKWQDEYRYADPIQLPAGSVLTMRYTYDNSTRNPSNPHHPPQRVRHGPQSTDEMAELLVQVLARNESDRLLLQEDQRWTRYAMEGDYVARNHEERGNALAAAGQPTAALEAYRQALLLSNEPRVIASMARALLAMGDPSAAVLAAERAVVLSSSEDPRILETVALAYAASGQRPKANAAARKAIVAAERRGLAVLADSLRIRWGEFR